MPLARSRERPRRARALAAHIRAGCEHRLTGGYSVEAFLRRFWQKKALLVRAAMPGLRDVMRRPDLFALAARDDVESRLIQRVEGRWTLAHGPFRARELNKLPDRNWTLLIQGMNLHSNAADALLRRFSFLPYARLDDIMVSYAAPGGGVGPHLDAYDVFLLQGCGRRRWRYGPQRQHALRSGVPLKLLHHFAPAHDEILHSGDMLYLPPGYGHDGIALDACTTYSIGFRAPEANELAAAFLDYLRDSLALKGRYTDPNLAPTFEPARIDTAMVSQAQRMLSAIHWDEGIIARFMGEWLSEPKPMVFFTAPASPLSPAAFRRAIIRDGVHLDRSAQLLYDDTHIFINGHGASWPQAPRKPRAVRQRFASLANERCLAPQAVRGIDLPTAQLLYNWYLDGWLQLGT